MKLAIQQEWQIAIQLLKDEELHRNMGERARESVYEQFRSEKSSHNMKRFTMMY